MEIAIQLPNTAPLTDLNPQYLKEALVSTLYHVGQLSEKEACEVLGLTRRAFEDLLPRFGFSLMPDDAEAIETELHA